MKKTKKEIMEEINNYAKIKNIEVTPAFIRRYLIEKLEMSRATAFRFFYKDDNEYLRFGQKASKRSIDDIEYTDDEYRQITQKAFELIHKQGKNSSDVITKNEIIEIAKLCETTPRYLSCNILGIETKAFDKIMRGEIKTTSLSLGLGFNDPELSEKVKISRDYMIKKCLGKKFTLDEIIEISKETGIPIKIILTKVFNASQVKINLFKKNKNIIFSTEREFIDYEYNDPLTEEIGSDINDYLNENSLPDEINSIFTSEDEKDSLYEEEQFYKIDCNSKEEYIDILNKKREIISTTRQYLTEKYDDLYDELLQMFLQDFDNVQEPPHLPKTKKILEQYISQLKNIIIRNPKYYEYYPPRLKLSDFEKIAKDFNIDEKYLAYKMFKIEPSHFERKKDKETSFFEIEHDELPLATDFYILFQEQMDNGIRRIVKKTLYEHGNSSNMYEEDLYQILKINVLQHGNQLLYYGKNCEREEEFLGSIFSYLKVVCVNQYEKMNQNTRSLNEPIEKDSKASLQDFIADKKVEDNSNPINSVLEMAATEDDAKIIKNMLICLDETESREEALLKLAIQMKIEVFELEEKLAQIYERWGV